MTKLSRRQVAMGLSIAAIAAAGCGSSSSSKTTAAPASTPATPSTASTTALKASTPITDPAVKGILVARLRAASPSMTAGQANQIVDCTVKKLEAEGLKTAGQLAPSTRSQVGAAGRQCAKQVLTK